MKKLLVPAFDPIYNGKFPFRSICAVVAEEEDISTPFR
jgi:KaiC/GvpD/RAD55 family RecA-like ATPase